MRVYLLNYNDILTDVELALKNENMLTDKPHLADLLLTWQDVRGPCKELAEIFKNEGKPVIVVQHGRGATRDYCEPNNFSLIADKILVWGTKEEERLLKIGINKERIEIIGCPLISRIKPKFEGRNFINILFCPIISEKEEPENLLVFHALKIWESNRTISNLENNFKDFKRAWAYKSEDVRPYTLENGSVEQRLFKAEILKTLPRNLTYAQGLINVKLTPVHDMGQYLSPLLISPQGEEGQVSKTIELLRNIDVLVCLEEGTMQLLACAMDIPIVVCDIFRYENYGGAQNYDRIEKINTLSSYRTSSIYKLGNIIDHALMFPNELQKYRLKTFEEEGGVNLCLSEKGLNVNYPNERIIEIIKSYKPIRERIEIISA